MMANAMLINKWEIRLLRILPLLFFNQLLSHGAFHAHLSIAETSTPWLFYTCTSTFLSSACFSVASSIQGPLARWPWQGWRCCIFVFVKGQSRWTCYCSRSLVSSGCTWCAAHRLWWPQTRCCPAVYLQEVTVLLSKWRMSWLFCW